MNPEDGISPWRNAKPRKPLSDYNRSPGGKSPNYGKSPLPQSPPNSGFKESTRMETSMDSPASGSLKMDLSGASPALFRGGEEKLASQSRSSKANTSKSKQSSFTKLRSVSRTPLQKKNKAGRKKEDSESEGSSEGEDDQPSGSCQFVGENTSNMSSSTINNTMGSTASVRRKGNSSVRQLSQSVTSPATTSTAPTSPPAVSKSSSVCSCLGWVFVAALAMIVYAVTMEGGKDNLMLLSTANPDQTQHWVNTRNMFRSGLKSLVTKYPNQTSSTWKMVSATLKSPMSSHSVYPGVLMLLSNPSSMATANCLANKLVELSSKSFSKPGLAPPPPSQLVIPALSLPSVDPHAAKEQLTSLLHSSLSSWGATAITSLHLLHPVPALTLHAFADNSNAPYKQAVLILSLSEELDGEQDSTSTVEKRAERVLIREWGKELGEDKLYALISRLVVSAAEVQKEEGEVLTTC